MNQEKQTQKYKKILQSGYKQFALLGYEKTTIDGILKEANISKGLFYHHFQNKKDLFLHLYQVAAKEVIKQTKMLMTQNEKKDFFDFVKEYMKIQFMYGKEYPYCMLFLKKAEEENTEIYSEVQKMMKQTISQRYQMIMQGLDYGRLKKDISPQQAIQIVMWISMGFTNQILKEQETLDMEEYQKYCTYLEILEKQFCEQ